MNPQRKPSDPWPDLQPVHSARAGRAKEEPVEGAHLYALGSLGESSVSDPAEMFDRGLTLLVRQLGLTCAGVATVTEQGLGSLWSAPEGRAPDPSLNFCAQVLANGGRTLVIRDAATDPMWSDHPGWVESGMRSYIGAPLRHSGKLMGVLSVQSASPHAWRRAEIALVNIMAHLFSRTFEVEALRAELWRTQEALDLTSAVVEDSALESPRTGLPNRRYLDVWIRSSLYLARRRSETMALATWDHPKDRHLKRSLQKLANSLRGEDLLVDMGQDRLLLLLPRTDQAGAQVLLDRLREATGAVAMGATVWNPLLRPDREDKTLECAFLRAQAAQAKSLAEDAGVAWNLVAPTLENLMDGPVHWDELREEQL